ncbi:MAG: glutamine--fructose-6-phosphate transaminase (isomerizing), partial [Stellaceae bacterium]
MCGIVGIIGQSAVAPFLIEGLRRLEYRGYDSAGIATLVDGAIERRRAEGKLSALADLVGKKPVQGKIGIGHTRWATHGMPSEANAHPIATREVAVVHNGIIENFQKLKAELIAAGFTFESQTDTEVVALLVTRYLREGSSPEDSVAKALKRLEGAFALVMLFAGHRDLLICARRGSPLAVGFGEGEMYVGSDALALAPLTRRILYLEEGDWAVVRAAGATIFDAADKRVERAIKETALSGAAIGKGNYPHYMKKEIFEQPAVIGDTLNAHFNPATREVHLPHLPFDLSAVTRVTIIACGTSYHAGLVAKYWIEQLARLPVEVDIASEFRYRAPEMGAGGLALFISQSGETADTLAALRYAKAQKQHIVAVVNQPESSIAREADAVLATHAGPEIGVASTKAFTTQLAVLAALTVALARARGAIDDAAEAALAGQLAEIPSRAAEVLHHDERLQEIAAEIALARDVLYLGRGTAYPLALEGALKLKEISYI